MGPPYSRVTSSQDPSKTPVPSTPCSEGRVGVFLGPAAGCPVLCGHRGCRGRWPVLRTADSQSLLCQGLSLCSPRSAARPRPRAFPRGFPIPQNPRSLHRLHLALAATVAELTLWTGGDGRPTRGLCGFPGLCSPPTLWTLTVDTRAWRGPSLGPGSRRQGPCDDAPLTLLTMTGAA